MRIGFERLYFAAFLGIRVGWAAVLDLNKSALLDTNVTLHRIERLILIGIS
jgi:hypothetical protein